MFTEGESMQPSVTAPDVEDYMLTPCYWIERTEAAEEVVINAEEIEKFKYRSFQRMKDKGRQEALYDLEEYPAVLSSEKLMKIMAEYSGEKAFPVDPRYDGLGQEVTAAEKEQIIKRSNFQGIADEIKVEFGILVRKQNLRAFPTDTVFAPSPDKIDMDRFQLTSLSANNPVAVLHKSSDDKWAYVQSTIYRGWLKSNSIALVKNRNEIFDLLNTDRFLVVSGNRVETEPNPFIPEISNIQYQMGDILPLAAPGEIPDSIPPGNHQAQSAEGSYVIKIPVRDEGGYFQVKLALIARRNDLHEGYLPYTRASLISQTFKMLGERYGWGGLFDRRDCSRFIMDIYRSVGVILPRDAGAQEEGTAGEFIRFSGSINEREELLNRLEAGDPLYMKGHVMVYLGRVGDRYYVIHDGAGYAVRDRSGEVKPVTVHGVFVMELHQLVNSGSRTYLEALTTGRKFR